MTPIIECRDLTKYYGQKTAIDHLSLTLPEGRVIGILGENGAGKSTFFRMVTGLVLPDNGELYILGEKPGYRTNRHIAYLPDRARWFADHKVAVALEWGRNFLPGFNMENAHELLKLMKLDPETPVKGMSKGQEARLMLVMCLSRDVPLVILDEPFSGIDTVSRERIVNGLIEYISEREQTILISTHEIYEVEGLIDHVVYLENGRMVLSEESERVRGQYGSLHQLPRKLSNQE